MAYSEALADRIRLSLKGVWSVKETKMMGGLTFMVKGKMCVGIIKDKLMCRIDPALQSMVLKKPGCRIMDFTGRPMKGFVLVGEKGIKTKKEFDYWIGLSLDFNKRAKASRKK